MPEIRPPQPETRPSAHYRILYANTFELRMGDNDVAIGLCTDVSPLGFEHGQHTREATVVMTPRAAKILARILTKAISEFEAQTGEIPIPESKVEQIEKGMVVEVRGQPQE